MWELCHLVCLHDDKACTLGVLLRHLLRLDGLRELQTKITFGASACMLHWIKFSIAYP